MTVFSRTFLVCTESSDSHAQLSKQSSWYCFCPCFHVLNSFRCAWQQEWINAHYDGWLPLSVAGILTSWGNLSSWTVDDLWTLPVLLSSVQLSTQKRYRIVHVRLRTVCVAVFTLWGFCNSRIVFVWSLTVSRLLLCVRKEINVNETAACHLRHIHFLIKR